MFILSNTCSDYPIEFNMGRDPKFVDDYYESAFNSTYLLIILGIIL